MTDLISLSTHLEIPRGDAGNGNLSLDMSKIYLAEGRIPETRFSNLATLAELTSVFNEACNVTNKYIAWIKYEILRAKRNYDLAKSTVIIDKLPEEALKLKEFGFKSNTDFRDALITRDKDCATSKDILDTLEATKTFLESKVKTFERAYWDSKENFKRLSSSAMDSNTSMRENNGYVQYPQEPVQENQSRPQEQVISSFIGVSKF